MLTREQCMAFAGLDHREVGEVGRGRADRKKAASLLASYRLNLNRGQVTVRDLIIAHFRVACDLGMAERAEVLFEALRQYLGEYPDARIGMDDGFRRAVSDVASAGYPPHYARRIGVEVIAAQHHRPRRWHSAEGGLRR